MTDTIMTRDNCPFTVTVLAPHNGTLRLSVEIPEGNAPERGHYEPDGYGDDGTQGEHVPGRSWGDATWPSDERIAAEVAKQLGHLVANVRFFDAADGLLDEAIYHAEAEPCLGGADTAEPCSAPATTLRCVDGDTSVALCAEHAAELDADRLAQYPDYAFRSHDRAEVALAFAAGAEVWLLDGDAQGVGQDEILIGTREQCEADALAHYLPGQAAAPEQWARHWHRL